MMRDRERKGTVTNKLGNVVFVRDIDASPVRDTACRTRGRLKLGESGERGLVCVGDIVRFIAAPDGSGSIEAICERKTLLSRSWTLNPEVTDPLVANADLLAIVVSVNPVVKPGIIDRYLVAGLAGGLEPIVVLNKIDLKLVASERAKLDIYRDIGLTVLETSALDGTNVGELERMTAGRICAFCGHSGVGKSSLINALVGTDLRVAEVSRKTLKGRHTTIATEMLPHPAGGYLIDTPGIKSFGVSGITADELIAFFPEIAETTKECSFRDCRHSEGQVGCAVILAVGEGRIAKSRWESYLKLKGELEALEPY
jgi:ribosome biogenesis GTPase